MSHEKEPDEQDARDAFLEALMQLRDEPVGLAMVNVGHYSVTVVKTRTFTPRSKGEIRTEP